jgi:hypothetical protein
VHQIGVAGIENARDSEPKQRKRFAAKDGAGAEGAMGEHTETVAVSVGGKDNHDCSCETNHVGVSPQEDRRRSKSTMGEGAGGAKEGGLADGELAAQMAAGFDSLFPVDSRGARNQLVRAVKPLSIVRKIIQDRHERVLRFGRATR